MSINRRNCVRALVALVAVGVSCLATTAAGETDTGQITIHAVMADATPLRNGNYVRAAGVQVGTVQSVDLDAQDHAVVTMNVERNVLPLHQDATATLVPQDLLGERYVDIEPGTPSAPEMDAPYTIPINHTKSDVDLQSVVDMVDDPTGTSLSMLLTTLGEGVGKNPTETAQAIAALKPAMTQTTELANVLNEQNAVLNHLVSTAEPVADAVATRRGASLDSLVSSTTSTLQATSRNREQLAAALQRMPGTLASAQATLAHLAGVAPPATRSLRNLRPLTDNLDDVSKELRDFSEAADPTLSSLRPVLEKGRDLLEQIRPDISDLRRGGVGLRGVSSSYRQLADGALSTRLVDLMEFMKGWSLSTTDYDAMGHYFRDILPYDPHLGAQTGAGLVPGAPNPAPNVPLPRDGRLPVPGSAANAPDEGHSLPKLPSGEANNGATGLSPNQEDSMVDQMLGGG
jgi:phospholipid/cholesterol/gamma-HCH transport system substrate-binding protein